MALKYILDSDAVIQRMALKDIDEVRDSIDSALTSSHVLLQGILCTVFEPTKTPRQDLFYPDSNNIYHKPRNGMLTLRLAQAFAWAENLTVEVNSTSRKDMRENGGALVPTDDYELDLVRGYVVLEPDYYDNWIRVTYGAGFDSAHKAPDWLQEAVLAYMPMLLSQPTGGIDVMTMRAMLEVHKTVEQEVGKMVEPYLRNRALQLTPLL